MSYFSVHNHDHYSNLFSRDSTNKTEVLIQYAFDLGLKGLAITNHETLSGSMQALLYVDGKRNQKIPKDAAPKKIAQIEESIQKWKDFKLGLGNEIYLTRNGLEKDTYVSGEDKFYHFVLIAKDEIGFGQLRELSTRAWLRAWRGRGQMRRPTWYSDIEEIVGQNKGHLIASTSCLGGFCPQLILQYRENPMLANDKKKEILSFLHWCQDMFGSDFYLEMQPSENDEQIFVNNELVKISNKLGIKLVISSDVHYLHKQERDIHRSFLNAQDSEREIDSFYATTYMMNAEELHSYMDTHIGEKIVDQALDNTLDIMNKIEDYDLRKPLRIPYVPLHTYKKRPEHIEIMNKYDMKYMKIFYESEHLADRDLSIAVLDKMMQDSIFNTIDRIETELKTLWDSSEKQNTRWSAYLLQTKDFVELMWDKADTIIGPGRGSCGGYYLAYLLNIIQIDPTKETFPMFPWRFLNPERVSPLDIDLDTGGNRREQVFQTLQQEYGEDHVFRICTFRTEKSKSAILTSCRGCGYEADIGLYLASMIKAERGLLHNLHQTFYGDEENEISPNKQFVQEMTENYPDVWQVAQKIEGLIVGISSHAGGIITIDKPITDYAPLMKTNKGDIVTQYDLADCEKSGLIKDDRLTIEALDRIRVCLDLLIKYGYIEKKETLWETYFSILGIPNLEKNDPKMWEMLHRNEIVNCFQMEQQSGIQAISLTKPQSVEDIAVLNSIMRLMASEKGAEQPLEKYARFKENPILWEQEMIEYGLDEEERKLLHKYLDYSHGMLENQESLMILLQDEKVAGWGLAQVDQVRKSIAKKKIELYEQLSKEFFENARNKNLSVNLTNYVWNVCVNCQRGYSFCASHSLLYSYIGLQEMNLAHRFPIIFWNCANLIVDSASDTDRLMAEGEDPFEDEDVSENTEDNIEDNEEEESPETKTIIKKAKNVDYGKVSMAIGRMQKRGITILPPEINTSSYTFSPNVETNSIMYGLRGITKVSESFVDTIIQNRPYVSIQDFVVKTSPDKVPMINLIKSGAFDSLEKTSREVIMQNYLALIAGQKEKLGLNNLRMLLEKQLLDAETIKEQRYFKINQGLKKNKEDKFYLLNPTQVSYFFDHFTDIPILQIGDKMGIEIKAWDRHYDTLMQPMRDYLAAHKEELLKQINAAEIQTLWDQYCEGGIAKWEMDSLGFYFTEHEFAPINLDAFEIKDFFSLPENAEPVQHITKRGTNIKIPIFNLVAIAGTVVSKNKMKKSIALSTPTGIVQVKVWDNQFTKYDKQYSVVGEDGKKKVLEKSWLNRGNKLIVLGIRRGQYFIPKAYARTKNRYRTPFTLITTITPRGGITMRGQRMEELT